MSIYLHKFNNDSEPSISTTTMIIDNGTRSMGMVTNNDLKPASESSQYICHRYNFCMIVYVTLAIIIILCMCLFVCFVARVHGHKPIPSNYITLHLYLHLGQADS